MPHVDILFNQLQKRNIDVISIKNYMTTFNNSIQKVRMRLTETHGLKSVASSSQRSKRNNTEDTKCRITVEVCDNVLSEVEHRFEINNDLMNLFQVDKF